ncbi:hypothetical protein ACFLRC_02410 [Candidatus Altiarchaeota archaeon]
MKHKFSLPTTLLIILLLSSLSSAQDCFGPGGICPDSGPGEDCTIDQVCYSYGEKNLQFRDFILGASGEIRSRSVIYPSECGTPSGLGAAYGGCAAGCTTGCATGYCEVGGISSYRWDCFATPNKLNTDCDLGGGYKGGIGGAIGERGCYPEIVNHGNPNDPGDCSQCREGEIKAFSAGGEGGGYLNITAQTMHIFGKIVADGMNGELGIPLCWAGQYAGGGTPYFCGGGGGAGGGGGGYVRLMAWDLHTYFGSSVNANGGHGGPGGWGQDGSCAGVPSPDIQHGGMGGGAGGDGGVAGKIEVGYFQTWNNGQFDLFCLPGDKGWGASGGDGGPPLGCFCWGLPPLVWCSEGCDGQNGSDGGPLGSCPQPSPYTPPQEQCTNGVDDDYDSDIDCEDSDCPTTCNGDCNLSFCNPTTYQWECSPDEAICDAMYPDPRRHDCFSCQGGGNTYNCQNISEGSDCQGSHDQPNKCCQGWCDDDRLLSGTGYHVECRGGPLCINQGNWGYGPTNEGNQCGQGPPTNFDCMQCAGGGCNQANDSYCTVEACRIGFCDVKNGKCNYSNSYQDCYGDPRCIGQTGDGGREVCWAGECEDPDGNKQVCTRNVGGCYNASWMPDSTFDEGLPQLAEFCCDEDTGENPMWAANCGYAEGERGYVEPICRSDIEPDPNGVDETVSCCNLSSKCVYQGECHKTRPSSPEGPEPDAYVDSDNNGVVDAICGWNNWYDCDSHSDDCGRCDDYSSTEISIFCNGDECWVSSGEAVAHGEYDQNDVDKGLSECCGDDDGEYFVDSTVFTGGTWACCDLQADCAWENASGGKFCCADGEGTLLSGECGTCDDGIDNDCDGFADEADSDCMCEADDESNCCDHMLMPYPWPSNETSYNTFPANPPPYPPDVRPCHGSGTCYSSAYFDDSGITEDPDPMDREYFGDCCGDDELEIYQWVNDSGDLGLGCDDILKEQCVGGDDITDRACCNESNQCVFQGVCHHGKATGARDKQDIDGDGVNGSTCLLGSWYDCDTAWSFCEGNPFHCNLNWVAEGEAKDVVGEYGSNGPICNPAIEECTECCGDDVGEYFQDNTSFQGGSTACCNNESDCAWSDGVEKYCCPPGGGEGANPLCGNCTDGVDNDCDGLADDFDPDCLEPPRCILRVYNEAGYCVNDPYFYQPVLTQGPDPQNQPNTNVTIYFNLSNGLAFASFCSDNQTNVTQDMDQNGSLIREADYNFGDLGLASCTWVPNGGINCDKDHDYSSPDGNIIGIGGGKPYYTVAFNAKDDENATCGATVSVFVDNPPPLAYASVHNEIWWLKALTEGRIDNTSNGTGYNPATCGSHCAPPFIYDNFTHADVNVGEPVYFTDDNYCRWCADSTLGWSRDQDECTELGFPVCRAINNWSFNFSDGNVTNISGAIEWSFADGMVHIYGDPGWYNVSLTVWDDDWGNLSASVNLSVNVSNPPPFAVFNASVDRSIPIGPQVWVWNMSNSTHPGVLYVIVGENITFDGNLSYDRDENGFMITQHSWDFNFSGLSILDQPVIYYQYPDVGVYNVTLNVLDDDSNPEQNISEGSDLAWMLVNVSSLRPLAYLSAWDHAEGCEKDMYGGHRGNDTWFTVFVNTTVFFCDNWWNQTLNSSDRDEDGHTISLWNWTSNATFNSSQQWPTFKFPQTGNYTVWLNVTDDEDDWNITNMTVEVIDSCGMPCNDSNGLPDTCASNCTHVCRYCNESGGFGFGVCEMGDCGRSCDVSNASSVCVFGCNYCNLESNNCVGKCPCPLCELTTMTCPSEGFVALNFTVNYTVWGAATLDSSDPSPTVPYDLMGWYYDEDEEWSCWKEDTVGCIYQNRSFNTSCPYGGEGDRPAVVNFTLNCSGILEDNLTCLEIVNNPTYDWHGNVSCSVDCYDLRSNVTLYLNSSCESQAESSTGYMPRPGYGACRVYTNASPHDDEYLFEDQVFDYDCLAGVPGETDCHMVEPPNDCTGGGCYYALEGNVTLYDVTGNGEYWWTVECFCDGNGAMSIENSTFIIDKVWGT